MSTEDEGTVLGSQSGRKQRIGWILMGLVLVSELAGGVWLSIAMVNAAVRERQAVAASAYATEASMMTFGIIAVVIMGTAWIAWTLVAAVRKRPWTRASNLTIQVLVFAGATGVLQGIIGDPRVGLALLVLAVCGAVASLLVRPARQV